MCRVLVRNCPFTVRICSARFRFKNGPPFVTRTSAGLLVEYSYRFCPFGLRIFSAKRFSEPMGVRELQVEAESFLPP